MNLVNMIITKKGKKNKKTYFDLALKRVAIEEITR